MQNPTFKIERELMARGFKCVAGIDEVGCGALAGPVVAAAVILPLDSRLGLVRDSKLLSRSQRESLSPHIEERAVGCALGEASVEEIEVLGLRPATLLAMRRAYDALAARHPVDFVLIDAWALVGLPVPQRGIIRGDRLVKSIAAASVIAKVARDAQMARYAVIYPGYGFEEHVGYATRRHTEALRRLGATPLHRRCCAPVRGLTECAAHDSMHPFVNSNA